MINENRIVPVEKIDLISLYGLIVSMSAAAAEAGGVDKLLADTIDGKFTVTDDTTALIADQPIKVVNFAATSGDFSSAYLFFVPAYDYEGFQIDGVAVETAGDVVYPDCVSLYVASLADGTVTIQKMGF